MEAEISPLAAIVKCEQPLSVEVRKLMLQMYMEMNKIFTLIFFALDDSVDYYIEYITIYYNIDDSNRMNS